MTRANLIEACDRIRGNLDAIDRELLGLKDDAIHPEIQADLRARGEAAANFMLAHRHLEDARMRLGKVIQALEGGQSILDHPEVRALISKIRADG